MRSEEEKPIPSGRFFASLKDSEKQRQAKGFGFFEKWT
jgi:hypothetical protein